MEPSGSAEHLLAQHQPTDSNRPQSPSSTSNSSNATTASSPTDARKSLLILGAIFLVSVLAMSFVYMKFPHLEESEKAHVKVPLDIEDAKRLGLVLGRYKDLYYMEVMFAVVLVYIFLQTFAIPGSMFLSILCGFLFSFPVALALVCFCSAIGATMCYLLSQLVGRRLVRHFFPARADEWAAQVERHRDELLSYMLFLRMTPFLPNWFINLVAPVIGVPLVPFAVGTFIGVAPPSFLAIQAGKTLQTMSSSADAFSWQSAVLLVAFAGVTLLPVVFKRQLKRKVE